MCTTALHVVPGGQAHCGTSLTFGVRDLGEETSWNRELGMVAKSIPSVSGDQCRTVLLSFAMQLGVSPRQPQSEYHAHVDANARGLARPGMLCWPVAPLSAASQTAGRRRAGPLRTSQHGARPDTSSPSSPRPAPCPSRQHAPHQRPHSPAGTLPPPRQQLRTPLSARPSFSTAASAGTPHATWLPALGPAYPRRHPTLPPAAPMPTQHAAARCAVHEHFSTLHVS